MGGKNIHILRIDPYPDNKPSMAVPRTIRRERADVRIDTFPDAARSGGKGTIESANSHESSAMTLMTTRSL